MSGDIMGQGAEVEPQSETRTTQVADKFLSALSEANLTRAVSWGARIMSGFGLIGMVASLVGGQLSSAVWFGMLSACVEVGNRILQRQLKSDTPHDTNA